jgi:hypothetical protein
MRNFTTAVILLQALLLTSCEVIGDIFGAGVYTGIFIVVFVIALIVFLVMRIGKK